MVGRLPARLCWWQAGQTPSNSPPLSFLLLHWRDRSYEIAGGRRRALGGGGGACCHKKSCKIKFKNPANYLGGTVFEFLLATSSSVSSSSSSSLSLGVIISPLTIPARIFNEAGRAGGGVATTPPDSVEYVVVVVVVVGNAYLLFVFVPGSVAAMLVCEEEGMDVDPLRG